ncbi:MAG: universal stress protein [Bacteroidia bacterium]|nr:universal stress protein [Bacteroidia bacterium]
MSYKLKNILVPTDFSDNSRQTLKAAVTFTQKIKGQIYLYHRSNLPPNWDAATDEQKRFNTLAKKKRQGIEGAI